jgi:hypothetical protein
MSDSPNTPDPRVIVGTYRSAMHYCHEHGLDPREQVIVTEGSGYKVMGWRFTTDAIVACHDADLDLLRVVCERARLNDV